MCFPRGTTGVTLVTANLPGPPDAAQVPLPAAHSGLFVCAAPAFRTLFSFFIQVAPSQIYAHVGSLAL